MTDDDIKRARAAKNSYQRAWRKANPDKVKAQALRHWLKVAEAEEAKAQEADGAAKEGGGDNGHSI